MNQTEIDWPAVHASVQEVLVELVAKVRRLWPDVQVQSGQTLTHLLLYSYYTFTSPGGERELVVGVDFRKAGESAIVRADICGNEDGRVWVEQEWPCSWEQGALQRTGRKAACYLLGQIEPLGRALGVLAGVQPVGWADFV